MPNLITDAWIPVTTRDGTGRIISPDQITDPDILRPDWPRTDLNIACIELLIGLTYLACPPVDLPDWQRVQNGARPDLATQFLPYAPAFELLGDGPRFLQELEPLEGTPTPPDMLFIDSAGGNTAKNNADLAVHRNRYPALDLPLAAMALYTLQAYAPSGGAGNRTSMRGGGPMVTLAEPHPDCGLWDLVWANVPDGTPAPITDLPWMRPTPVSKEKGTEVTPTGDLPYSAEAFFGMPRRLRLLDDGTQITGVIQKTYGTNYALWKHPLSPHYRLKPTSEWLPKHPKPGRFGYHNWLGIIAEGKNTETEERALSVTQAGQRFQTAAQEPALIVAGWAMSNMKPLDMVYSRQPCVPDDISLEISGLIEAAHIAARALRSALSSVLSDGESFEMERDRFYAETEEAFLSAVAQLRAEADVETVAQNWLSTLTRQVTPQFYALAVPGMDESDMARIQRIVTAQRSLAATMAGHTKLGRDLFKALELPPPPTTKRNAA